MVRGFTTPELVSTTTGTDNFHNILVIDSIDRRTEPPGIRIQCGDLHGDLPEVFVRDDGDRFQVLEAMRTEATKICAIVRNREEMAARHPGCQFLPHTLTDKGVLVVMQLEGRTILADADTYWKAYRSLMQRAFRRLP